MSKENKWLNGAIPALFIHCSIGTVYCWSTFKESIANEIGMTTFQVGWAFSFAIFFLGISAAFAGSIVERNIKRSSFISMICFTTGLVGTGISIQYFTGWSALLLIYLFYGCIMGIGLGVGYITPVKTLMIWFSDRKGLATGISIMGFGLSKAIATPIMELLQQTLGISSMFYVLGFVYFIMMYIAHLLIKKPDHWVEIQDKTKINFHPKELLFSNNLFISIWIMFYINIHCGLMVISCEKQIIYSTMDKLEIVGLLVVLLPSISAICNALGRIGYAGLSDIFKYKISVYRMIFQTSLVICLSISLTELGQTIHRIGIYVPIIILWIVAIMIINLGYGGGFSTLPILLESYYGMDNISKIHGIALTAWSVAGITGNNTSEFIVTKTGTASSIIWVAQVLYAIAYIISITIYVTYKKYKHDD